MQSTGRKIAMGNDKWREEREELRHQLKIETDKRISAEKESGNALSKLSDFEYVESRLKAAECLIQEMVGCDLTDPDDVLNNKAYDFLEGKWG